MLKSKRKSRTVADYRSVMSTYFVDWQNKPIAEITKDMVGKRYTPMQKITDYILKCAGIKPSADVVALVDRIA